MPFVGIALETGLIRIIGAAAFHGANRSQNTRERATDNGGAFHRADAVAAD
jgi:hypothetical protein